MAPITMFRFTAAPFRQARHLLANSSTRVTVISPVPASTGRRTYARPRPNVQRSSKSLPSPKQGSRPNIVKPKISLGKRSLAEFQSKHKKLGLKSTAAEEAYDLYSKYIQALTTKPKPADWQEKFIRENNLTAEAIYHTALFLWEFPNRIEGELHLFCHMLNAAAALGHDSAAISLGFILARSGAEQGSLMHYHAQAWAQTRARCDAIIALGDNAYALVLEGFLYLLRESRAYHILALGSFEKAAELTKDVTHFGWRWACLLGMGEAQLRLGFRAEAEKAFRLMADFDYAEGYFRLAMLNPEADDYVQSLTKAAASGVFSAYEPLMLEHLRLSQLCQEQGKPKEAERHALDAAEWGLLLKEWNMRTA